MIVRASINYYNQGKASRNAQRPPPPIYNFHGFLPIFLRQRCSICGRQRKFMRPLSHALAAVLAIGMWYIKVKQK